MEIINIIMHWNIHFNIGGKILRLLYWIQMTNYFPENSKVLLEIVSITKS